MKKFIILFCLVFATIFPQGKDGPLLKAMQTKFSSLHDFSVEFSQEVNGKVLMTGKLSFKKENMLWLEMKNLLIVSDGVTNWNYSKKEKKVIISSYDADDASLFSPKKFVFDYPNQCKVKEVKEGERSYLLLLPGSSSVDFKQAKVFPTVDRTLQQIIVTANDGSVITFHFSNFRGDQNFDKEKFSFQIFLGSMIASFTSEGCFE